MQKKQWVKNSMHTLAQFAHFSNAVAGIGYYILKKRFNPNYSKLESTITKINSRHDEMNGPHS